MRKYIFPIVIVIIFSACVKDDNKHPVPDVPIYVDVNIHPYLNDFFEMYLVEDVGYMGNGILIVNTGLINDDENPYKAYDATCPNEVTQDCAVEIDESSIGLVECSCCGSQFEVTYGDVNKGPANYPLKSYKTAFDGTYVRVYN